LKTLQVEPIKRTARWFPGSPEIRLDRTEVKVQGFMIPLDIGDKQNAFLSAVPLHCQFCLPAGPTKSSVEASRPWPTRSIRSSSAGNSR
jgi:hypothetical protein